MTHFLFYLFLVSIPLGYRVILYQFTPGFNEYTNASLYASDILLVGFLGVFVWKHGFSFLKFQKFTLKILLSIFLLSALISVFNAYFPLLALYNFFRLLLLALTALAVSNLLANRYTLITSAFGAIAGLAVTEAVIAFIQFFYQKSIGLWFLGEPALGFDVLGSAKIIVEGGALLRAYGTLPHPNVLGAFLVVGLLTLYYFWLKRPSEYKLWSGWQTLKSDMFWGLGIFITLFGIVLTFSRSAWITGLVATAIVIFYFVFVDRRYFIQAVRLTPLFCASIIFLFAALSPFIIPRAELHTSSPAVSYRLSYNELGTKLIKEKPLGVGIGNQVIYSVKNDVYKNAGLDETWEWQPVHNLYILLGTEVGILGLLAFIGFLIALFAANKIPDTQGAVSKIMLLALLVLGATDHYLWTLQSGQLLLWVVVGMVMAVSVRPAPSSFNG